MERRELLKGIFNSYASFLLPLSLIGCGGNDDNGNNNDDDGTSTEQTLGIDFTHGIASGDPLHHAVVLWTRAVPVTMDDTAAVNVIWEVAEQADFSTISATGNLLSAPENDYTVKVDVQGLRADTMYYFRFRNAVSQSLTGITRTLPVDASQIRLAVFSCANYPAGYFNVYREASKRNDFHAALHLGDYIYEYDKDGYASADAESLGRVSEPVHETVTLADYRRRYAQYRTDAALVALHQKVPFILVWDDHEIANQTYKAGADNHDQLTEGDFEARVNAAVQAWYEWLPVREPLDGNSRKIYRRFDFGNLLSLHMLDTRLIGRDKPLDYDDYTDVSGNFDPVAFTTQLSDPERELLGTEQLQWLQRGVSQSTATWQVLGQQVLIGRMNLPAPLALRQISIAEYSQLVVLANTNPSVLNAEQRAILEAPAIPASLDSWDGYPAERERVLATARSLDKNLVVLSGDTHNAWASDLQDAQGNQVGVEFATGSVSSPGLEETFADQEPELVAAGITQLIEPLQYTNTHHRGYMVLDITKERAEAEWVFVNTVKTTEYSIAESHSKKLQVLPGSSNRRIIEV